VPHESQQHIFAEGQTGLYRHRPVVSPQPETTTRTSFLFTPHIIFTALFRLVPCFPTFTVFCHLLANELEAHLMPHDLFYFIFVKYNMFSRFFFFQIQETRGSLCKLINCKKLATIPTPCHSVWLSDSTNQ
jgi:hypothetical protein